MSYIGYTTIKVVQENEICICLWEDLIDNIEGIAQLIGEEYIEPNMLFQMQVTQPFNGEDALIGFNEMDYDGIMTVNFNTYFSEN